MVPKPTRRQEVPDVWREPVPGDFPAPVPSPAAYEGSTCRTPDPKGRRDSAGGLHLRSESLPQVLGWTQQAHVLRLSLTPDPLPWADGPSRPCVASLPGPPRLLTPCGYAPSQLPDLSGGSQVAIPLVPAPLVSPPNSQSC